MCNCIAYEPSINFEDRTTKKTKFSPYSTISVYLSEVHICPFCGKILKLGHYNCNCTEFQTAYNKLVRQERHSRINHYVINTCEDDNHCNLFIKPVVEIQSKLIKKSEVKNFGTDFWDFSKMYSFCGKSGFRLANPSYKNETLQFYWKNLATKSVFLCTLENLCVCVHDNIIFQEISWENNKPQYDTLLQFQDWNEFCKKLKEF